MIEMRGGKDLKYSNQLPSWAKAFHFLVITELREDGYYTSITNNKTSKIEESFIPFQQMS